MPLEAKKLPHAWPAQWLYGATYPLRALVLMRQLRLWRLAAVPAIINALLIALLASTLWLHLWPQLQQAQAYLQATLQVGPEYQETLRVVLGVGRFVAWLILLPVVLVACAVVVLLCGQTLSAPWLDLLAERVENHVLGRATRPYGPRRLLDALFVGLGDAVWGLFYLVIIYIPVLLATLLPGVGAVASLVGGSLFLAQQFCGHTLARGWLSYRARWQIILDNRWMCMGFGTVAMLLLSMPLLGLITLPVATVGGTLLCCDLIRAGRAGPHWESGAPGPEAPAAHAPPA